MIGAVIGDIVGSRFEWNNNKSKSFDFLDSLNCFFTDDTVMTLAIAKSLLECKDNYNNLSNIAIKNMVEIGRNYPDCGFGGNFYKWIMTDNHEPYNSFGNGAAMRVSACGIVADSIEEAIELSKKVTLISHNHPEGMKGAEAVSVAIFLAKTGWNILDIRDYITKNYYDIDFKLSDIRDSYKFNETCQGSVPQAFEAFFESTNFEDAIRNAISIGGDSDTIAAITGSIAASYYGVPSDIRKKALTFLDERLLKILVEFENKYTPKIELTKNDLSVSYTPENRKNIESETRELLLEEENDVINSDDDIISTSEKTSSQKLFNHLYEACNILRGPINQDEYKSYVTPILFFKRISDVYDEETQVALEISGGDQEFAEFPDQHSFIIPEGCHWSDVRNSVVNVGMAIVNAMSGIERANPDTLSGVFSSFDDADWTDKTKLSDERLKNLIEHMSKIKVGNKNYSADVMGDAYEYLIKKFADLSKANAGEFYTPRAIVRFLVNLLQPKKGDDIYDPACGTGGMLIEAIKHIDDKRFAYGHIYGQEKNLATSAIARMNLFLHGAKDFKIVQGDTLRNPKFIKNGQLQKFDCVIANPPFSLDHWGSDVFSSDPYGRNIWGTPGDSVADYAWLQHMICSLNQTGRCAVILPQGVLFRGNKESEMRQKMVDSDMLECVVTFVQGIFFATGISACALLLNKNKSPEHKGKICMIDGTKIYTAKRAQNIMTKDNVDSLYKLYDDYKDVENYAKIVTIEDVKNNNYILKPKNFIESNNIEEFNITDIKNNFIELTSLIEENEKKLRNMLEEGGYLDE